jgi:hypothetical protein
LQGQFVEAFEGNFADRGGFQRWADTGCFSVSMPDKPTSSLGRWKPVSCSSPLSLRLKVFRAPERTA